LKCNKEDAAVGGLLAVLRAQCVTFRTLSCGAENDPAEFISAVALISLYSRIRGRSSIAIEEGGISPGSLDNKPILQLIMGV
jgi:hypothetical protein